MAWGEFLVGVALILGIFTGVAAFFGSFIECKLSDGRDCEHQPHLVCDCDLVGFGLEDRRLDRFRSLDLAGVGHPVETRLYFPARR